MPKFGETRGDGYRFNGMNKSREHWVSPETWAKKKVRMSAWAKRNREAVKQSPVRLEKARKTAREHMRKVRVTKPVQQMLIRAKCRAKKKGLPFTIEVSDIRIPDVCPVLGIRLEVGEGSTHDGSPELDRVVNAKGYVKGNVVVVSRRANRLKNDATLEELQALASFYAGVTPETTALRKRGS